MRSSDGRHIAGLDHIRGFAAFLVVAWHFVHGIQGSPSPFGSAPILGPLDEGHSGVGLFMTLSGFLFARLIGDRFIRMGPFLWNRVIRLGPLLISVIAFEALTNKSSPSTYLFRMLKGFYYPVWPNGGWSIAIELQFYLLLPFLITSFRRWPSSPVILLCTALSLRLILLIGGGPVKDLAYLTLFGRIDQFVLGMVLARMTIARREAWLAVSVLWCAYALFDRAGGFNRDGLNAWWVILPTIEGLCFAVIIGWYESHPITGKWERVLTVAGNYSYSIYLLHTFFVFAAARLVDSYVLRLNTTFKALPFALIFFLCMMIVGHLSFRLIEKPLLRLRMPYLTSRFDNNKEHQTNPTSAIVSLI